MKTKKKYLTVLIAATVFFTAGFLLYRNMQREEARVPDAVNSTVENGVCRLTVIVNRDYIDNKEKFAYEVIDMCRRNSFHSIKISTDVYGWPESLKIKVYLKKDDINRAPPLMQILYEPEYKGKGYDIRSDYELYHLIIS